MRFILSVLLLLGLAAPALAEPFDIPGNIRALASAKHPYAQAILATANRTDKVYADFGQHDSIAWVMTGERKYLDDAVPKLQAAIKIDPLPNVNDIREYFAELVMIYGWLRPDLTAEQNAEFEKRLNRWCEITCAINTQKYYGGWNYADSDATTGYYLGLLLHDQLLGTEWTKRDDARKAREAIRSYAEKAKGGVWVESAAYNLGTLQFLLLGAHAAGIENFPEIEALVPDIAEWQLAALTPDFKQAYQWSDDQEPRGLHIHGRISLFGILYGLTGDARFPKAVAAIMPAGRTFANYAHLSWRAVYFARVPEPEPAPASKFLRVSEGNGHFVYKRDNAALYVHFPKRLGVHHEVGYAADVQLYLDGEWVLTKPVGYGLPAVSGDAANAPLFAGLSSMASRGPTDWKKTATGCEITGGTQGPRFDPPIYDPPPAFVESFTRVLNYEFPGKLTVKDSFKGVPPTKVDRYGAEAAVVKASPLWQQVWHCPVEPTATPSGFTWKTPSGKTVTLMAPEGCKATVIDEKGLWAANKSNFAASELKWQIRFSSDEPECEMVSVLEVK